MFEGMNWRKVKKIERHIVTEHEQAYYLGQEAGERKRSKRNPYPPGRRHESWEYGYSLSKQEKEHGR